MTALHKGGSRRSACRTSAVLAVIALAALIAAWPARGVARQACNVNFTLNSVVITDFPSVDCETAKEKAYRKAIQDVQNQRAAYVCPAACPTLVEVTPPHITCDPECTPVQLNGVTRYDGTADAEGTYKCVP